MGNFVDKYNDLRKESLKYIEDYFEKNNITRYEFATLEDIESEDFVDNLWEYPQATYIGKHDFTDYYAIVSITLEKGNLWFNGVTVGEDSGDYNFGSTEVDVACLCDCSDLLTLNN
jgi:hypothetical protein